MKRIRKYVRNILLEWTNSLDCIRDEYWGIGGSGVVVLCTEDDTIYMQRRSYKVSGGRGQWGFPGGGIPGVEGDEFYATPIYGEDGALDPNDPVFESNAFKELEEEAGYNGLPRYKLLDSLVSYEDCGFIYKTFIIDIPLSEKQKWVPEPNPRHAWETIDDGWFAGVEWKDLDIYFGFSPILIRKIDSYMRR